MKQVVFLMVAILLVSVTFANALEIKSVDTPTKKIRFTTEDGQYVSSVIVYSNIGKEAVDILEKHFSQEREAKVIGLIWENIPEGPEVMFHVYDMDNNFVADVRIATKYFSYWANNKLEEDIRYYSYQLNKLKENSKYFSYRINKLEEAVEAALNMEIKILDIRQKGDNSRQAITITESGLLILEL